MSDQKTELHNNDTDLVIGFKKVAYVWGPLFLRKIQRLPKFGNRAVLVHTLIEAYNLLEKVTVLPPEPATEDQLKEYHSENFIEFMKFLPNEIAEDYGIGYDCPVFEGLFETVCAGVGASLCAAHALTSKSFQAAINWTGGWHHAKKDEAAGFCYLNDIVLAILELRKTFDKVLYVDLDLHHGDGVEDAFTYFSKVFCFSVHKYSPGFFPCSGSLQDVGNGKGKFYTMNVPLLDGIKDGPFSELVLRLISEVKRVFKPDVVVVQCGADGLFGDPFNCFNLTLKALGNCLREILDWKLPLLLLGGGGYHDANTARCWAYLTSIVCNTELSEDIPDHENLLHYGPGYELPIGAGNRPDLNSQEYLKLVTETLTKNLNNLIG